MNAFLPILLEVPADAKARLRRDYDLYATDELPAAWEEMVREDYGLEVAGRFAGLPLRNPFGCAGGPLCRNLLQVREASEAGLGFVTLIAARARDEAGATMVQDWRGLESEAVLEGHNGDRSLTWLECGWYDNLDVYAEFLRAALEVAGRRRMPVIPAVRFGVNVRGQASAAEARHTVRLLQEVWHGAHPDQPAPLEVEVLPEMRGLPAAQKKAALLRALRDAVRFLRASSEHPKYLHAGLKLGMAPFDAAFQARALEAALDGSEPPAFLVLFNRLRRYERWRGSYRAVSCGGPELARRNFVALDRIRRPVEFSALGDITTGRRMVEYALRGATSGQMHTVFQLPESAYRRRTGNRVDKALHELAFHPEHGLVAAMLHVKAKTGVSRFLDLDQAAEALGATAGIDSRGAAL
ncbi:MAG: hypothetical protein IT578_11405 [Verrucomicrobiae bacterium]|nr:hypothetical protein [Verrucomicrobiae bacterium]